MSVFVRDLGGFECYLGSERNTLMSHVATLAADNAGERSRLFALSG